MRNFLPILILLALPHSAQSDTPSGVPEKALELHQRGYAELENEKPENASPLYREVVKLVPDDPLGYANLAVAELRQQNHEVASRVLDTALAEFPGDPRLLAIKSEIKQWSGDLEGALELLDTASQEAPEDLEILYATYHLATTVRSESADAIADRVLAGLAAQRPENVVVLLQLGHRSIARGDRAAATGAFLRLGELLWQEKEIARRALGMVTDALEGEDIGTARVPAMRLENVLKVSAMFRESLRELKTGIQGIPLEHFRDQPPMTGFGPALAVRYKGTRLDTRPTPGDALVSGDFDGDSRADLARLVSGDALALEVRLAAEGFATSRESAVPTGDGSLDGLFAVDLDNDGHLDLLATGPRRAALWIGAGDGTFAPAAGHLGLGTAGATDVTAIDFDIEGDLDLVSVGAASGSAELYRNTLQGPLEKVGDKVFPSLALRGARAVVPSDLDRDGDLDLAIAHGGGLTWLDNLRQGRFELRSGTGLASTGTWTDVVSADLDGDTLPELIAVGKGVAIWHNRGGSFEPWPSQGLPSSGTFAGVTVFDADNDGRLDLATVGEQGVTVWRRSSESAAGAASFVRADAEGKPSVASVTVAADLDGDGDLDLAVAGSEGLHRLESRGAEDNGWLAIRLVGLAKGNSKNNVLGVGSVVEVRDGQAVQFREAEGDVVHFGLGARDNAEVLRVVWTNGVPQNRLDVGGEQRIVEEQVLKGSCPFVYVWNGERFAFGTDLLWGAPIGLPLAPGVWAPSDPDELVRLDGLVPGGEHGGDGVYHLRLTEELWEAAFFDHVRLWVVDHPAEVEVASNLRIVPNAELPHGGDEDLVLASREVTPVSAAWDGQGRDVTARVRVRDDIYADGYHESRYQGVTTEPWAFTFDLGRAPATAVRLHLDGWIFPSDASLNLAVAQRDDLPYVAPRLEVETEQGWTTLLPTLGFPAGKTKTMVVDTPPLPPGAHKLRIVSSLWLHWDRVAWTTAPDDQAAQIVARLLPSNAELRFRGFSRPYRVAPNGPHVFDYQQAQTDSPWLPLPGRYTRYGDVAELLASPDDLSVILAPGDEIALSFDAGHLPPRREGWQRTLFLESHGWDKDADRNTYEGHRLEPLPFRAMRSYGEPFPVSPKHARYLEEWLTRELP